MFSTAARRWIQKMKIVSEEVMPDEVLRRRYDLAGQTCMRFSSSSAVEKSLGRMDLERLRAGCPGHGGAFLSEFV
jgi:hypothetical protein